MKAPVRCFVEGGDEITKRILRVLTEGGVKELPILAIDHVNCRSLYSEHACCDKNQTVNEALMDIYRVMRPGEPPTLGNGEKPCSIACSLIERYDLQPLAA